MPFCPTDHSEIAPPRIRGRLITLFQLAITLGIALGYFVDLGTQNLEGSASWRVPFAIQIVTSVALAAGCLVLPYRFSSTSTWFCSDYVLRRSVLITHFPISPRWLIYYGRDEEGLAALASMRAGGDRTDVDVVREYGEIRAEIKLEREMAETSWIELVKGTVLKRTLIGVFIQTFQ
ncbi:LOW QUALITY PROTEIN: transporter-domain-containing protein, partial [Jimgerdemannia flammicorona]